MDKSFLFKTTEVTDRITRITGVSGEMMYLVEGDEKAALIDTGVGIGDLKGLVEKLTKKPVMVILTHGHVDHAMGALPFKEIYMNQADEKVYNEHFDIYRSKEFAKMSTGENYALIDDNDYVKPIKIVYKPLLPGTIFSLGGISLEIYRAEGHTPGSVTVLFREERILLLGDACNSNTFLFDANSSPVEKYKEVLEELDDATRGKYDRTLFSHGTGEGEKDMIRGVIKVCEDILAGKADDIPFEFMGHTAFRAKAIDSNYNRLDNGTGNIIYNKDNIRIKP